MYQQVEARIVVLAVLRMIKENHHSYGTDVYISKYINMRLHKKKKVYQ